ncbi:hypothetical protein MY3957_005617 [Beauveria namnaoensis]
MTRPAMRKPCDELSLKTRGVRRRAGLLDGVGESGLLKANLLAKAGAGGGNGARRISLSTWHTHQLRPFSSPSLRTVTLRSPTATSPASSLVPATPLREICWVAGGQYVDWTLDVAALLARPPKNGEDDLEARFKDKSSSNIRIDYFFYHSTINEQCQRFAKKAALCLVHFVCVATLGGHVSLTAGFGGRLALS